MWGIGAATYRWETMLVGNWTKWGSSIYIRVHIEWELEGGITGVGGRDHSGRHAAM